MSTREVTLAAGEDPRVWASREPRLQEADSAHSRVAQNCLVGRWGLGEDLRREGFRGSSDLD